MSERVKSAKRKGLIIAILLAIVAMPMSFAGVGFCRSMPCCPPHLAAHPTSIHQPDCCNTTACDQAPAAAGEYTTVKQIQKQTVAIPLIVVQMVPATSTVAKPVATSNASPPFAPSPLQRRMAILSIFLI